MSLKLASVFTDHAVLQRDIAVSIWGWATPGDRVTVQFAGQSVTANVPAEGRWIARLAPLTATAEARTLTVTTRDAGEKLEVNDLLVGDVWICSGQSNMQWSVNNSNNPEQEIAAAKFPLIRLFSVPNIAKTAPVPDVNSKWRTCTPETVGAFSAVGYFFGREIFKNLDLPVGLINTSWGGTIAEAWTSRDGLNVDPYFRQMAEKYDDSLANWETRNADFVARQKQGEAGYYKADPGNTGLAKGWAALDTNVADWPKMTLPGGWTRQGHNYSGVFWFRREIEIPADWAGKSLALGIGAVDKIDVTYFNGVEVGRTELAPMSWCEPRAYTVPGDLVKPGRAVIAVRALSHVYDGGMIGPAAGMKIGLPEGVAGSSAIPLTGPWLYQVEHNYGQVAPFPGMPAPQGPGNPNSPYILYHSMIEPLLPLSIRGAIWYQGESNAGQAYRYRSLFKAMINDWRRAFDGGGNFPFLFVQLANYMVMREEPVESAWAELREAQSMALELPNVGQAVIIDIGDAADIHPRNKQDVGKRLAYWALANHYGKKDIMASGPLFRELRPEGKAIRLSFNYACGLKTSDGASLRGFAIAGADRKFVWADAVIDGKTVVVSNPSVAAPVAVRYAWQDNPACNLTNRAGIPASPFRTDTWPGVTQPKDIA